MTDREAYEVGFVSTADEAQWKQLFYAYADFYQTPMDDAIAARVWAWLLDPAHPLEGLAAKTADGRMVGIVHVRACPRSLGGCEIGFVDDMFVAPDARGSGAADALVLALKQLAGQRGWPTLRWITQHFNERGRALYDRYTGGPSDFIVYQLQVSDSP